MTTHSAVYYGGEWWYSDNDDSIGFPESIPGQLAMDTDKLAHRAFYYSDGEGRQVKILRSLPYGDPKRVEVADDAR